MRVVFTVSTYTFVYFDILDSLFLFVSYSRSLSLYSGSSFSFIFLRSTLFWFSHFLHSVLNPVLVFLKNSIGWGRLQTLHTLLSFFCSHINFVLMIINLFFEIIEKQNHHVKLIFNYFLKTLYFIFKRDYLLENDTLKQVKCI